MESQGETQRLQATENMSMSSFLVVTVTENAVLYMRSRLYKFLSYSESVKSLLEMYLVLEQTLISLGSESIGSE